MQDLASEILRLQEELEHEIAERRQSLGWHVIKEKLIEFEEGVKAGHRRLRITIPRFLINSTAATVATAPLIYSLVIPFALLDLWMSLYQAVCFRVYGIPLVRRAQYVVIDRQHLAYLNGIEILNCVYCGYANGVIAYVREIASRTEQYWCPIKHALRVKDPHQRYFEFLEYGDAEGYRRRLMEFRDRLRAEADTAASKTA